MSNTSSRVVTGISERSCVGERGERKRGAGRGESWCLYPFLQQWRSLGKHLGGVQVRRGPVTGFVGSIGQAPEK